MIILPTFEALGTKWLIEIFDDLGKEESQITYEGLALFIKKFDDRYSHFKHKSIINNLSDSGFLLEPDQMTIDLLEYGLNLYHQTNGVFNFLSENTLSMGGYNAIYSSSPIDNSVNIPDPTQVLTISKEKILLVKGQIDIGGYGKGYLIDLVAKELKDTYQIKEFIINGGGDMYATTQKGRPVKIYLEHPTVQNLMIAETTLCNEGFAASSTSTRQSETDSRIHSQIIDPKTGESHNNALGVFIKAPTAAVADAWATTLLISTPDHHLPSLEKLAIKVTTYSEQEKNFREWGSFF
ncbi:MAG TPA: FAD:protein FMN transferase [Candidatus Paceibacterota bacterium]|nr:FAD:protein FMN transferase [Candidatus Paceibacterota bacterium]HMO83046.1 FAD:protein FMN transferase [Candidatus Paceibacterota bacterium]